MTRPRATLLTGAILVLCSSCEKRDVAPGTQRAPDGGAVASPMSPADSADSLADSTRRPGADSGYIGYDSAFGPLFAVDSTGKMVELPVRRP